MFFVAIDISGPQIYTTSPSGIYRSYNAFALGSGESTAREYLQNNYKENMTFKETIDLALKTIKESIEDELTKENIRISYIRSSEENRFKLCSKDEVNKFILELE